MPKETMTLIDNRTGKRYEYPIIEGTRGPAAVDMRSFYRDSGMFSYDPGFTSTASCRSEITFINGEERELRYRGIPIEDLATGHSYLEVIHLLLEGELPTDDERTALDLELRHRSFLPEGLVKLFEMMPDNAHPMSSLSAGVTGLSAFYYEHLKLESDEDYRQMAHRIIAKMPTLAAFAYRHSLGATYIYPDIDRSFTENFLYMLRAYPGGKLHREVNGPREIKPIEVEALDTIFTLHADHEQNASTTVVRSVASTGAHPYVAIASGIAALWGRAHGGANESVIEQLKMIGSVENVDKYIARAKDPDDPFRLMGFGHRVYKNFDPRARILKTLQDRLTEELDLDTELMRIARRIEEIALNDDYFISRKLYPNIDFYSGIILTALGLPRSMFTPVFVIGRTVGWVAQWIEFKKSPEAKIARPRQVYVGK